MNKTSLIAILIIMAMCMTVMSIASAVSIDHNMVMSGTDVSLIKGYSEYKGIMNDSITQHEQYIYSVNQAEFDFTSTAAITDFHEVAIETNMTGVRAQYSGIGGTDYIENIGSGDNESCCVFGIRGSGHNLTVASIVGIQPTTLSQTYVIEATYGEAASGYVKQTENVTVEGTHIIRGKEAIVAGYRTCTKAPESFVGAEDGKPSFCVWKGAGVGYPFFSVRHGNETAPTYSYYVRKGMNTA